MIYTVTFNPSLDVYKRQGHGVNSNMLKMFCFICEKILAPDDNVW